MQPKAEQALNTHASETDRDQKHEDMDGRTLLDLDEGIDGEPKKHCSETQGNARQEIGRLLGEIQNSPRIDEQKEEDVNQKTKYRQRGTHEQCFFARSREHGQDISRPG